MDIGSLYRRGLAQSHGKAVDEAKPSSKTPELGDEPRPEQGDEPRPEQGDEPRPELGDEQGNPSERGESRPPRSIIVSRGSSVPYPVESSESKLQGLLESSDDSSKEARQIIDLAFKELETAKRKADVTLATARSQASRVYREARRDARKLLSKARRKAERLEYIGKSRAEASKREAYEKGFEEGRSKGLEEVRQDHAHGLSLLRELSEDLAATRGELAKASELRLAGIMMSMLRRVVGKLEGTVEDLLFQNLSRAIREHFQGEEEVFVRCNPIDLEEIEDGFRSTGASTKEIRELLDGRKVHLKVDATLPRGACRLWSDGKGLALSFEERLEALERELFEFISTESNDESG